MAKSKLPPHDLDLEAEILASFLAGTCTDEVFEILQEDDFYSGANRRIFQTILSLSKKSASIDITTVQDELRSLHRLTEVGGSAYLIELIEGTPANSTKLLVEYAKRLKDKSRLRQTLHVCQEATAKIYCDPIEDSKLFIDELEHKFYEIGASYRFRGTLSDASLVVKDAFKSTIEALQRPEGLTGISSGLKAFDQITGGLHDAEVTIIGGRPGMSKTSFVTHVCQCVALQGYGSLLLSQEMPAQQLGLRMIVSRAHQDLSLVRSGDIDKEGIQRLKDAEVWLSENVKNKFWIDDQPALTLMDMRSKIRRTISEAEKKCPNKRLGVVAIDYLQLSRVPKAQSRETEISELSRGIKALAKEFKVPVLLISQLNRALELRPDKKPQLSDLRESGAIEQDGDNVIFLYRPAYYGDTEDDTCELIVAKQRQGKTGTVEVRFDAKSVTFLDKA